jgi:PIN domain nuclease of toxin-antitoxin system
LTQDAPPRPVVDSSATLAVAFEEAGAERVLAALRGAVISAVSWSETLQKAGAHGLDVQAVIGTLLGYGLTVVPFDARDAARAAELWIVTRTGGLSLADRACIALGERLGRPVLTGDRSWLRFPFSTPVLVFR